MAPWSAARRAAQALVAVLAAGAEGDGVPTWKDDPEALAPPPAHCPYRVHSFRRGCGGFSGPASAFGIAIDERPRRDGASEGEAMVVEARAVCDAFAEAAETPPHGGGAQPGCWGFSLSADLSGDVAAEFYPEQRAGAGGCGEASDVLVEMGAHLRFDPRRIVYQRPRDARDAVSLPPACDVERRFWGHQITPGASRPQKMCLYVDCLGVDEREAAAETWASLRNLRDRHGRRVSAEPWVSVTFLPCIGEVEQGRAIAQGILRWVFEALAATDQDGHGKDCDWHVFVPGEAYVDVLGLWEHLSCYPSGAELWWLSTYLAVEQPPPEDNWGHRNHPYGLHALSRPAVPLAAFAVRDGACTLALFDKPTADQHVLGWKTSCCDVQGPNPCFDSPTLVEFCCGPLRISARPVLPGAVQAPSADLPKRTLFLEAHNILLAALWQVPDLAGKAYGVKYWAGPLGHVDDTYVMGAMDRSASGVDVVTMWNITRDRCSPSAVHVGHEPACVLFISPLRPAEMRVLHVMRTELGLGRTSSCTPQAVIDQRQHEPHSFQTLVVCGGWWMALRHGSDPWDPDVHPAKCAALAVSGRGGARAPAAEANGTSETAATAGPATLPMLLARTCCLLGRDGDTPSSAIGLGIPAPQFWRDCFDHHFTPRRCCSLPGQRKSWRDGRWAEDGMARQLRSLAGDGDRHSVMLIGLPRSGTTWLSYVIAAAYDLKEGLRRTPPRQRGLLARLWLRRLRASVRAGGMARGGGFLEDVYRGTFGRGREERSPSRGVFIHEFFVPGQYFRWEKIEASEIETGFGHLPYFTKDKTLLARLLMKITAVMGASFYTNYHNMLREVVPSGTVEALIDEAWRPSGFRFTKEVQMQFRVREFANHFRVFGLLRHRYVTFPSSAPQIFLSLYQSLQLNDYVDPRHRAVKAVVLELASTGTDFDKIVLAHTAAALFGLRHLRALGAPVLRWEDLILLANTPPGQQTTPSETLLGLPPKGGRGNRSSASPFGQLRHLVEDVLGPTLGIGEMHLHEVLRAMMWPGAWGIGVADRDLQEKARSPTTFRQMSAEEWLMKRRGRYFGYPGARETESKVQLFLRYMEVVLPDDDTASYLW